jgi:hypothetical protein
MFLASLSNHDRNKALATGSEVCYSPARHATGR